MTLTAAFYETFVLAFSITMTFLQLLYQCRAIFHLYIIENCQGRCSSVFITNFEQITHIVLAYPLLNLDE